MPPPLTVLVVNVGRLALIPAVLKLRNTDVEFTTAAMARKLISVDSVEVLLPL